MYILHLLMYTSRHHGWTKMKQMNMEFNRSFNKKSLNSWLCPFDFVYGDCVVCCVFHVCIKFFYIDFQLSPPDRVVAAKNLVQTSYSVAEPLLKKNSKFNTLDHVILHGASLLQWQSYFVCSSNSGSPCCRWLCPVDDACSLSNYFEAVCS